MSFSMMNKVSKIMIFCILFNTYFIKQIFESVRSGFFQALLKKVYHSTYLNQGCCVLEGEP